MPTRARARLVALSAAVALTAFLVGAGASSASANVPEHLKLAWSNGGVDTLTLPSSDEFDDGVVLDITSNQPGTADLAFTRLSGSGGSVFAGSTSYVLGGSGTTWTGTPSFEENDVTVGSWQITVKVNGATEKTVVKIGSGVAKTVKATVQLAPVFENSGVAAHALYPHIVARDELGTSLPILQGTATFTDAKGKNPVTRTFESPTPSTPGVTLTAVNGLNIEGTNPGVGTLRVSGIQGPSSSSKSPSSTSHPKISITKSATTVDSWPTTESGVTVESWDGKFGSGVVAGTYTVKATITLTDGNTLTKTTHLVVSTAVPVQKTVTVLYKGSDLVGHYLGKG
jgi:hypothetical protein